MRERSRTTIEYAPAVSVVTRRPFCVSEIVFPGPTVATSRCRCGGVGEGGGFPTVNAPAMSFACGSQTYEYLPSTNVTVHVTRPISSTVVVTLTPGPERWKLWKSERSSTMTRYSPGSSCVTTAPCSLRSEIVKSGPTVPNRSTAWAAAG